MPRFRYGVWESETEVKECYARVFGIQLQHMRKSIVARVAVGLAATSNWARRGGLNRRTPACGSQL